MIGITHKQARRYINALADGLIEAQGREDLNAHLDTCEECRAYASKTKHLESKLQQSFHHRLDRFHGPSEMLVQNVQGRVRRVAKSKRINLGLRLFAGLAALLVLGILFSSAIGKLIIHSTKNTTSGSTTPVVSSSSRLIAFVSTQAGNSDIYVMRTDGSNVANLTNNPAWDGNPVWSPDGAKIAFESDRNGNRDIFVMNPDGSGLTQLTNDPANDILGASPTPPDFYVNAPGVWSPEGRHISFSNDRSGQWVLYDMNADGSGVTQLVQANDPPAEAALWSPGGKQVAYISKTGNDSMQIVAVNIDGTDRRVIATGDPAKSDTVWNSGVMISWSQDEKFFYYERETEDGYWYVVKTAADGSNTSQIIASGYALVEGVYINGWLGNDSVLYYITESLGTSPVFRQHGNNGKILQHWDPLAICHITPNANTEIPAYNWAASKAGSQLILAVPCQNNAYTELYSLDSMTGAFNEIAQIPNVLSEINTRWSADDQTVMIHGNDPSGKTEIYLLNAGDLQTKSPLTPRLIYSGESSQAILQPLRSNP